MKLRINKNGTGSFNYTLSISMKEAAAAGLVDENGERVEIEKAVENGVLVVRPAKTAD